jgi:hypothetical protein
MDLNFEIFTDFTKPETLSEAIFTTPTSFDSGDAV